MADKIRGHVTVEKTAKWIKLQQLLAWGLMIVGMGYTAVGYNTPTENGSFNQNLANGAAAMAIALVWVWVLRVVRWWCHD
jgi:hypothetical protein